MWNGHAFVLGAASAEAWALEVEFSVNFDAQWATLHAVLDAVDVPIVGIARALCTDCSGEHREEKGEKSGKTDWRLHFRGLRFTLSFKSGVVAK